MTRAGRPIIRLLLFALLPLAHTGEASGLTDRPPCEPIRGDMWSYVLRHRLLLRAIYARSEAIEALDRAA